MGKRATLTDVARLAGLSPSSVSLILNNKPDTRLSDDARRRVKEAVEVLGYRPNVAARSLVTNRTQTIALITDHVATTRFGSGLVKGTLSEANERDHVVLLLETDGDDQQAIKAVSAVLDRQVDGIIFSTSRAREMNVPTTPSGMKVVMLNATNSKHELTVLPDEFAGGKSVVELLKKAGHGPGIVLLGQNDQVEKDVYRSVTIASRIKGMRSAMLDSGFQFLQEVAVKIWEPEDGYEATKKLLSGPAKDHITAIICINDRLAFGAYQAIVEQGMSIPNDISIASFDNDEVAAYLRPGLTTIENPYEEMGAAAVRLLLDGDSGRSVQVPMKLVERASISAPREVRYS